MNEHVSITEEQLKRSTARELLILLKAISADGRIADEEIKQLNEWLERARNEDLPAVGYLRKIIPRVLEDHYVSELERRDIIRAILQVLPEKESHAARLRFGKEARKDIIDFLEASYEGRRTPISKKQFEIMTKLDINIPVDCTYREAIEFIIQSLLRP